MTIRESNLIKSHNSETSKKSMQGTANSFYMTKEQKEMQMLLVQKEFASFIVDDKDIENDEDFVAIKKKMGSHGSSEQEAPESGKALSRHSSQQQFYSFNKKQATLRSNKSNRNTQPLSSNLQLI